MGIVRLKYCRRKESYNQMGKKDKGDILDDYKKLKDEIIIDKVNEIFRSRSDNYIAALEEIGFEYHEEDDEEEIEEREAKPKNKNQRMEKGCQPSNQIEIDSVKSYMKTCVKI